MAGRRQKMEKTMKIWYLVPTHLEARIEYIHPTQEALEAKIAEIQDLPGTPDTIWGMLLEISELTTVGKEQTAPGDWMQYWAREIGMDPWRLATRLLRAEWSPYGEMRLDYLKEEKPQMYREMSQRMTLPEHLMEVQARCRDMIDQIVELNLRNRGIQRDGSASTMGETGAIAAQARELVLDQEVYR
jgi:hypothetical protein